MFNKLLVAFTQYHVNEKVIEKNWQGEKPSESLQKPNQDFVYLQNSMHLPDFRHLVSGDLLTLGYQYSKIQKQ